MTADPPPNPEPAEQPSDPHLMPLDDEDDARWLDPIDARRRQIELRRGYRFED